MKEQDELKSNSDKKDNNDKEPFNQEVNGKSQSENMNDENNSSGEKENLIELKDADSMQMSSEDLKFNLFSGKNESSKRDSSTAQMEELAEDMLHVIEGLNKIEKRFERIEKQIQDTQQTNEKYLKGIAREVDQIRNQLLSERKAFVSRSVFNAILPAIESLEITRKNMAADEDNIVYQQIRGILDLLKTILQTIGYTSFLVEPGEEFNVAIMECTGYAEGDPGIVIEVERPGYKIGESIAKPCGVIVGKKEK